MGRVRAVHTRCYKLMGACSSTLGPSSRAGNRAADVLMHLRAEAGDSLRIALIRSRSLASSNHKSEVEYLMAAVIDLQQCCTSRMRAEPRAAVAPARWNAASQADRVQKRAEHAHICAGHNCADVAATTHSSTV